MVTVVTMFQGTAAVSKTPSPSTRPSRKPKRTFVPAAQSSVCTAGRRRKYHRFPLPADGGMLRKAEPQAVPFLRCGYHMQTRRRLPQKPQTYPLPAGSPRHFAARRDESVIVGYYTLKKCVLRRGSVYTDLKMEVRCQWQGMMVLTASAQEMSTCQA